MSLDSTERKRSVHFLWLPSLYFFQALPFFLVTSVSTILYKNFGVSNTILAIASSVFYLPWVLKAFAGPFVESHGTLKKWMGLTQFSVAVLAAVAAVSSGHTHYVWIVSVLFFIIAVVSMFQDVAAEGLYIAELSPLDQTWFVGVRATFFRLGWLSMQGLFVAWIGWLGEKGNSVPEVWLTGFGSIAALFFIFSIYHWIVLPPPRMSVLPHEVQRGRSYFPVLLDFFKQPELRFVLLFLLFFRFGEAQMQKMIMPFFLDPLEKGGLALTTKQVGLIFGSLGPFSLTLGGLLGGWIVAKQGLKKWFVPMCFSLNIPNLLYVFLAYFKTRSIPLITLAANLEQFFYGFGFTAYLLFMIQSSRRGKYPTAGYAVGSGLMAVGMMIPGAWSGALQEGVGYTLFFTWAFLGALPSLWVTMRAKKLVSGI